MNEYQCDDIFSIKRKLSRWSCSEISNNQQWTLTMPSSPIHPGTTNLLSSHNATNAKTSPVARSCHKLVTSDFCCHVVAPVQPFRYFKFCRCLTSDLSGTPTLLKHAFEAIYCGEMTADGQGWTLKTRGAHHFEVAFPTVLNFWLCCLVVTFMTQQRWGDSQFQNEDKGSRNWVIECNTITENDKYNDNGRSNTYEIGCNNFN